MESVNKIAEIIKTELAELETRVSGRKAEIENAYKAALQVAEQTKKEALKEFEADEKSIEALKNSLQTLTGESFKRKETKPAHKNIEVPKSYSEAKSFSSKVVFALNEIKRGTVDDVKIKILELEPDVNEKSLADLNQRLSGLYKAGQIGIDGKVGRKYLYII